MAKIQPGTTDPAGTTQQAIQFSNNRSGSVNMQYHPNNLRSMSPSFVAMNNLVILLDAQYDQLSPTDQALWEISALAYAGMKVCGCLNENISGKKLYRLVNFSGQFLGQPITSTPPPPPLLYPLQLLSIRRTSTGSFFVQITYTPLTDTALLILNSGAGLSAPTLTLNAGTSSSIGTFNDPAYAWLKNKPTGFNVSWCFFSFSAAPAGAGRTAWDT